MTLTHKLNHDTNICSMTEQYENFYSQFAEARFLPDQMVGHVIYDIKSEYGSGTIEWYELSDFLTITLYDYYLHVDVETAFSVGEDYFEVEYCDSGEMVIESDSTSHTFTNNHLSVSLGKSVKGSIIRPANSTYQGISIASNEQSMENYLGTENWKVWKETIGILPESCRLEYYFGKPTSFELMSAFKQINNCKIPYKMRSLYYESKVIEILTMIMTQELIKDIGCNHVQLTEYEITKIKEIPNYLQSRMDSLPTMGALTKELGLSESTLKKGFKMIYGDTIFSYHRKHALKVAANLLINTQRSVTDIAYEVGYSNSSNFCAAFKKRYGMSPLQYRDTSFLK